MAVEEEYAIVTGFEPFGLFKTNPSWECVKTLEPTSIEIPGRDITLHTKEVPVEYTPILNVIPTLHQATFSSNIANDGDEPRKPYKYFFHVGVGSSGNVVVETIGRRTGYTMPDNQNFVVPEGKVTGHDDYPDTYRTRVDVPALVEYVKTKTGYENVKVGTDMGLYLCEFIFYVSMAESQKTQQDATVLFVHLPPEGDPYSLEQDRDILRAIIDWVVTHY